MNKDQKINGIRCWEQAFRVYATIYCGANPHQAKEIWQYIAVINSAAAAYVWDNVAAYDVNFRHLMAFNPQRNWGVMYNHMWNLCLRDPLPRNSAFRNNSFPASTPASFNNHSHNPTSATSNANTMSPNMNNNAGTNQSKKKIYCWNWNKGVKCRFGSACKFIE